MGRIGQVFIFQIAVGGLFLVIFGGFLQGSLILLVI
jgi:hypothetical protein